MVIQFSSQLLDLASML